MKFHVLPLTAVLNAIAASALKVPFKQAGRSSIPRRSGGTSVAVSRPSTVLAAQSGSSSDSELSLNDVHDLIYIANVTVGGTDYPVQLDTGSSDLWIKGPTSPLPNANQTSQTYNLTYGIGWAYGHISYAPTEFAGISIASQAFLDISSAQNPALGYGADGILGLGFTSLSTIDALVNNSHASTGRSLLFNLFQDNPSEPNFISVTLQRSGDQSDQTQGSFAIGEYEPQYAQVANNTPIPTWPVNSPTRWNVLLDALLIGDQAISVTSNVSGAPSGKAVTLLDSGTSWSYAPPEVCEAIYGGISGAQYDASLGQWVVPCSVEIDMALQIGGQVFPLHPLDVTPTSLTDPSTCVGSFVPQAVSVGTGEFDWLVGDNFLRSVYSIYDFGDFDSSGKMGNPYVKLLALIDPDQASVDFHNARGGTPETNITYNAASGSLGGSTTVTLSNDVATTLDKIGKYFPAMLGVMALNALVLIVLVIVGIVLLCRKRRSSSKARRPLGRLSPMPMNRMSSAIGDAPNSPSHVYQPVSMALTEDTLFAPPSPAFRSFEGNTLRSADRPKSVA